MKSKYEFKGPAGGTRDLGWEWAYLIIYRDKVIAQVLNKDDAEMICGLLNGDL